LEVCVAVGLEEVTSTASDVPYPEDNDSPMMKAALAVTLQKLNCYVNELPELKGLLFRSESPSGKCAKLRTVAASKNRIHMP